jgi:hypothetical protein
VQISALFLLICTVLFIYSASSTSGSLQSMWQGFVAEPPQKSPLFTSESNHQPEAA